MNVIFKYRAVLALVPILEAIEHWEPPECLAARAMVNGGGSAVKVDLFHASGRHPTIRSTCCFYHYWDQPRSIWKLDQSAESLMETLKRIDCEKAAARVPELEAEVTRLTVALDVVLGKAIFQWGEYFEVRLPWRKHGYAGGVPDPDLGPGDTPGIYSFKTRHQAEAALLDMTGLDVAGTEGVGKS